MSGTARAVSQHLSVLRSAGLVPPGSAPRCCTGAPSEVTLPPPSAATLSETRPAAAGPQVWDRPGLVAGDTDVAMPLMAR
jgi:hypothetical protein